MHVADVVGRDVFELTAPFLDRCFAGDEVRYAGWFAYPSGRCYPAVTYSPLRPESERVEAALVINRDLTEHVLAADALQRVNLVLNGVEAMA